MSDKIARNIKAGNATELSSSFNTSIELSIMGREETYSKTQAEMILKDFFAKNKPKNFTISNKGVSDAATKFINGKLETNAGIYKIYILMKSNSGSFLITELRIE
ncbi:MAG: DUF4783 domain-containing protein [Bacteroidota bacterium]|nr:DUF4783 domain-containing protein [Bacteroidota bacterium]